VTFVQRRLSRARVPATRRRAPPMPLTGNPENVVCAETSCLHSCARLAADSGRLHAPGLAFRSVRWWGVIRLYTVALVEIGVVLILVGSLALVLLWRSWFTEPDTRPYVPYRRKRHHGRPTPRT
jgi:hypothetical protein